MFPSMRRIRQQLSDESARMILAQGSHGVLALNGGDGYPYAVPVSYAVMGDVLYFHSALRGHKVDAIARDPRVSFAVVGRDDVKPATFTTHFESVVAFGRARLVVDAEEKRVALMKLAEKYSPGYLREAHDEIAGDWDRTAVYAVDIERLTGKQARELVV